MDAAIRRQDHAIGNTAGALVVGDRRAIGGKEDAYLLVGAGWDFDFRAEHRQKTLRAGLRQQVYLLRAVFQIRRQVDESTVVRAGVCAGVNLHIRYGHEYMAERPVGRRTRWWIADREIDQCGLVATAASATPCH